MLSGAFKPIFTDSDSYGLMIKLFSTKKEAEIGVIQVRDISLADMDSGMAACIVVCTVPNLSQLNCLPDLR